MNRREFIVGSTAALLVAAAGGSYVFSGCPLDTEGSGICTGPCSAFIDFNGDGFCDRLPPPIQIAEPNRPITVGDASPPDDEVPPAIQRACPFGLLNDPYPGQCHLYVDTDGDGICDLSQTPAAAEQEAAPTLAPEKATVAQPTAAAGAVLTACPLGMVNDPYPGECRHYVDENGNGICDLSEPELVASGAVAPPPTPTPPPPPPPSVSPTPRPPTACPYGLVNDPYPGECRHYVDENGNGICDLSEPELVASGVVTAPPAGDATTLSSGQRQRGRNK